MRLILLTVETDTSNRRASSDELPPFVIASVSSMRNTEFTFFGFLFRFHPSLSAQTAIVVTSHPSSRAAAVRVPTRRSVSIATESDGGVEELKRSLSSIW